ncbi:hypothetical protein K432DRAFT_386483 [Lepidopterella palustris CBS 459.81]|uniref:Uncharacterized protein n=1 Tax=Lepidopterella palustris CBS 459.81 TaxID=1314670 RepID=A0A8E2E0G9_9PEZI|nr:hypothetical protein K432DRAFT_386483 [Lepidopterella palustris CBS 459.81]
MPPIPPIPIHANDPITPNPSSSQNNHVANDAKGNNGSTTAAKPSGITPHTAPANPLPTRTTPASAPVTATTDPFLPPPPQPGARPVPAPARETGRAGGNDGATAPPQPVPGVHIPRSVEATVTTTETRVVPTGPPAQFAVPAPEQTGAGGRTGRSTSTYAPAAAVNTAPGPTTLNLGAAANPSPYQAAHPVDGAREATRAQNLYAVDGSAAQRRSLEDAAAREKEEAGERGVWGVLGRAGEMLKGAEEKVWRAVGKKG